MFVGKSVMAMVRAALLAGASLAATAVAAEDFPSRPVTMVVPFAPGGSSDQVARPLAAALARVWDVPVVVSNKPGGGGALGMTVVRQAKPDGYTIALTNPSYNLLPITDQLFERTPIFAADEFAPLGRVSAEPILMVAKADAPWKDYAEFVEDARKSDYSLSYASSGSYGSSHVPTEMLSEAAGMKLNHVSYSGGGGPSITAVLAGEVDVTGTSPSALQPMIAGKQLKPLVQTGSERHPLVPDTPTAKELGYDVEFYIWSGLFTGANVPDDVVAELRDGIKQAVESPEFRKDMDTLGLQINYLDGQGFSEFLKTEAETLSSVVEKIGRVE